MPAEPEEDLDEFDEIDDDFGDPDDDDLADEELHLDLDDDTDFAADEGGGGGTRMRDEDLLESNYEEAVRANPKRKTALRKRRRRIEGILDDAELSTPKGRDKAWDALSNDVDEANVKDYDIKDTYTENDVLEHPKFGTGFVVEILSASKISVLFEDGLRKLAYDRGE